MVAMMEQRQKFAGASHAMTQFRDYVRSTFGSDISDANVKKMDDLLEASKSDLIFNIETLAGYLSLTVHRGVVVRLVADEKDNVSADRSGKARAALGALVNAGADVRTIRVYPIHHDKVIIADRQTVELGSFNYSDAAAHKNSENVLVNWSNAKLAEVYLKHFDRNYAQATTYVQGY
jgi:phosphatidylserine/phosphatidylglycerophosphate/cardiolipin synthase-like enzyme